MSVRPCHEPTEDHDKIRRAPKGGGGFMRSGDEDPPSGRESYGTRVRVKSNRTASIAFAEKKEAVVYYEEKGNE